MKLSLEDILADIHAMEGELLKLEKKYGVPSEDFYALYTEGKLEHNPDFQAWAAYYEIKQDRQQMYRQRVKDVSVLLNSDEEERNRLIKAREDV